MSAERPPGWYDEPSGDRVLLRWWDGRSWTSVTRQRSPFEAPPPADEPDAQQPPADVLEAGGRRPGSRRTWTLVAIAAAVVGLLLVVGLPGRGGGDRLADPGPRRSPPGGLATPPEPSPATPSPRPVSGRVTDRVAKLSYDVLPGQWREWDRDSFLGLLSTLGYYRITQDSVPNGQTYWANVTSGPVRASTASRQDLRASAQELVGILARQYYPAHSRRQLVQQERTVDGAPAYLVRYRAVFNPDSAEGYTAKSEEVAVLVVDTGADLPSALYISLPDTVRSLWPAVDGLLSSVRIVR